MSWSKQVRTIAIGTIFWLLADPTFADVHVIVSRNNGVDQLSRSQVADIFLCRTTRLSDGKDVVPIDLAEDSSIRNEFYMKLLGKSPAQMKAYWSKLIFTGRGLPPKEVASSNIIKTIARNPIFIGYTAAEELDSTVKSVMQVD